ncbi:hypothetical protein Slin15195_G091710 [Septoria linicola]|uniref:Uncharacterized protein n=1 Tax=Septoria linicola TaxID=215465 RepID=A0A9Q9AU37_9PEZI|nr:hypothetical protein Slin15195_G091710 [Septoria linicola]
MALLQQAGMSTMFHYNALHYLSTMPLAYEGYKYTDALDKSLRWDLGLRRQLFDSPQLRASKEKALHVLAERVISADADQAYFSA